MKLVEFTISHYCERARWALDHHGLPWESEVVMPGPHALRLRRLGVRRTTVPVLMTPGGPLQGSDRILDWADANGQPERALVPEDPDVRQRVMDWEERLDRDAGRVLRQVLYDSLLTRRHLVVDMWTQGGPAWGRAFYTVFMPVMDRALRRAYRIRPEEVARSTEVFAALADDLDAALAEGPFLTGETFTRADLTAASLLAPLVMPDEHHVRWPAPQTLPEDALRLRAVYANRPFFHWVAHLYRTQRHAA